MSVPCSMQYTFAINDGNCIVFLFNYHVTHTSLYYLLYHAAVNKSDWSEGVDTVSVAAARFILTRVLRCYRFHGNHLSSCMAGKHK